MSSAALESVESAAHDYRIIADDGEGDGGADAGVIARATGYTYTSYNCAQSELMLVL